MILIGHSYDNAADSISTQFSSFQILKIIKTSPISESLLLSLQNYLFTIGAKPFDVNNLELVSMTPNEEFVVFIHADDVKRIHMLPNLFKLKQMEKVSYPV